MVKVNEKVYTQIVIETGDTIEDLIAAMNEAGKFDQISFGDRGTLSGNSMRYTKYISHD